jgi:hypothetical protein
LPSTFTQASPFLFAMISNGATALNFATSGASAFLPINLLIPKRVFFGLVTDCLFATCPTRISPLLAKPTIEGVVLCPSAFSITCYVPFSSTATHEFVVPKSIPIIFPI